MEHNKVNLRELLAEARAIHYAMKCGQLSYERAKIITEPYLNIINKRVRKIARLHGVHPKEVKFHDLNKNL